MYQKIRGFCWRFGDDVNTDAIFPQRYSHFTDPSDLARHAMEGIDPEFPKKVRPSDIIVAGVNFGCGSSMEHAPLALKSVGVGAVVAVSFARTFYRNAISLGIPVVESRAVAEDAAEGDELEISLGTGEASNITRGKVYGIRQPPEFLMTILERGGLIPHLKKKLGRDSSINRI
jgi:3-isopropylmalate/(R)-2-methylmalate dehydratase small subunit